MRLELLSTDGAFLIPWAKQRLAALDTQRRSLNLLKLEKIFIVEIFTVTIIAMQGLDTIRIEGEESVTGFICHPRNVAHKGGWDGDGKPLGGDYNYPLIDDDGGSRVVSLVDGVWVESADAENYGNIDWKGINTAAAGESSNAPVLTWRGPTGRTLPCNVKKEISGLTAGDIEFDAMSTPYYTCFGPNIYQSGEVLATIPALGDVAPKVLGAAICDVTLLCIVNNHYADRPGFFDEIWVQGKEWHIIKSEPSGRAALCWFFNQSGTKATRGTKEYVIDLVTETVSIVNYDNGSGTYSLKVTNDSIPGDTAGLVVTDIASSSVETNHNGEYAFYSDYKGDERVQIAIKVTDRTSRVQTNTVVSTSQNSELWTQGVKPVSNTMINGPEVALVGAQYVINGVLDTCCPYNNASWKLTGGTMSATGLVLTSNGCGMGLVEVNPGPGCDIPTPKNVRLPRGVWAFVSDQTYGTIYPAGGPWQTVTQIIGPTKIYSFYMRGNFGNTCPPQTVVRQWNNGCFNARVDAASLTCWCAANDYGITGGPTIGEAPYVSALQNWYYCNANESGPGELVSGLTKTTIECSFIGRQIICTWVCATSTPCTV